MSEKAAIGRRSEYPHFLDIPTRWMDNDVYAHVNNVNYYSYFDTVVNRYLIDQGGFDYRNDPVVGIVVETLCRYHRSFAYPEMVQAGLRIAHIGRSSVRYQIGLFGVDDDVARAEGHFVHVYVERETNTPVSIPDRLRAAFERIRVPS